MGDPKVNPFYVDDGEDAEVMDIRSLLDKERNELKQQAI